MITNSLNKIVKYNIFTHSWPTNTLSISLSFKQRRTFTAADNNNNLDQKDYYNELFEKSKRILEKINVNESELLHNKDVVVYTRNRTCTKCDKVVKIAKPEFIEDACADSWRYFHNFSYVPNCPVFGIMKFVKYNKLRTEQKVAISNQ